MFEEYRTRMSRCGAYMGDTMRKQTQMIVDATWMNSVTTLPVCITEVKQGLPPVYYYIDEFEDMIYAHFEKHKNYNVGGNAVDFKLVIQPHIAVERPDIKAGSYVCIPDINNVPHYWLITYIEEDNGLIVCRIMQCNWRLKWVDNNVIHECLGVLRGEAADSEGLETAGYISTVESKAAIWLPSNEDTKSIGVNTRFLISDSGRTPPQAWKTSKILDTLPIGMTKITLVQDQFNQQNDNAELMIADYFEGAIEPTPAKPVPVDEEPTVEVRTATISYSGSKPTLKVGGSWKTFAAEFTNDSVMPKSWSVSDGTNIFSETTGDYTIEYIDNKLRLKVKSNYYLIGKILTIQVIGTDDSTAELAVEVIG